MKRLAFATLFLGTLCLALPRAGAADDDKPCTITKETDDHQVGKACKEGGIKRAKAVMKAMQKVAKKNGMDVECDSCHKNEDDWALTSDAKEQFKKMLEIVAKAK